MKAILYQALIDVTCLTSRVGWYSKIAEQKALPLHVSKLSLSHI